MFVLLLMLVLFASLNHRLFRVMLLVLPFTHEMGFVKISRASFIGVPIRKFRYSSAYGLEYTQLAGAYKYEEYI